MWPERYSREFEQMDKAAKVEEPANSCRRVLHISVQRKTTSALPGMHNLDLCGSKIELKAISLMTQMP